MVPAPNLIIGLSRFLVGFGNIDITAMLGRPLIGPYLAIFKISSFLCAGDARFRPLAEIKCNQHQQNLENHTAGGTPVLHSHLPRSITK